MNYQGVAKTKAEIEVEQHLLPLKVKLSDGTDAIVFQRQYRFDQKQFVYTCLLCGVMDLPGEIALQRHVQGRKHQTKMEMKIHDASQFYSMNKGVTPVNVCPGEPVPPGFEDEIKPQVQLQVRLDQFKQSALVGLEYIMELYSNTGAEPSYHCILCDKRGDPRTIMAHLTSFMHRVKYLEKHFPGVIKEIGDIRMDKEALKRRIPQELIERICKSIEDYYGRLLPNVHPAHDYEANKMRYLQEAIFDKHFDERTGPKFLDAVDKKAIELFYKKIKEENEEKEKPKVVPKPKPDETVIELSDASDISSGSFGGSPRKHRKNSKSQQNRKSISPFSRKRNLSPRRKSRSPSRQSGSKKPRVKLDHLSSMSEKTAFDIKQKSKSLIPASFQIPSHLRKQCEDEIKKTIDSLESDYKKYQKSPEKHPDYNDEWKTFWNKRYKDLVKEGKDPYDYDFKPEWIEFWKKRMQDIYDKSVELAKEEIPKKYDSRTKSTRSESKRKSISLSRSRSRSRDRRRRHHRGRSSSLSSISSIENDKRSRRRSRSRSKSRSRISDRYKDDYYSKHPPSMYPGYEMDPYGNYYGYPHGGYYPPTHHPSSKPPKKALSPDDSKESENKDEKEEEDSNEPVTLVSVLRLISALESHLGQNLAPRVIDLLSKALALEKVKPNSSDDVLLSDEVCVLLETVKEKLKGILNAKLVRESEEKAIKKAVKNIAELIHIFSQKYKSEKGEERKVKRHPVEENLATRIKSALIVQGYIDTPESVIDELIQVFLDMAKHHPKDKKGHYTVKKYLLQNKHVEGIPTDKSMSSESSLESLTDSDLKTLLQNFKDLSSGEQKHLITYLKKLESSDPERVKKLRSYVEHDDDEMEDEPEPEPPKKEIIRYDEPPMMKKPQREEPQDPRLAALPPALKPKTDIFLSDDEDDYNYDDLVKSTNSKTRMAQDTEKVDTDSQNTSKSTKEDLSTDPNALINKLCSGDTQNLIASLMGSLQQSINTINKGSSSSQPQQQPVPVQKPVIGAPLFSAAQNVSQNRPIPAVSNNQPVAKPTSYNQYVALNSLQATREKPFAGGGVGGGVGNQQQNQFHQNPGNGSMFPMQQQQQQPPAQQQYQNNMYGNQAFTQYPMQGNMQNYQNNPYNRPNMGNQGVNPWQIQPQQQQQQQQQQYQQQNNPGSQPFYQYYQN